MRNQQLLELGGLTVGCVGVGVVLWAVYLWFVTGVPMNDLRIYELAADRVNSGGAIYDLRAGDGLPIGADRAFPIYGPPGIVVPWRMLSAVPWGPFLWVFATTLGAFGALFYVHLGTRGWAGASMLAGLALPVVALVGVANVDALILPCLIAAWRFRDRPLLVGILIGLFIPIKLTPVAMVTWLTGARRWRALFLTMGIAGAAAVATALVTTPDIWLRYAGVALKVAAAGHPQSMLLGLVGAVVVLVYPDERVRYAVAVSLIPIGTPQGDIHSWAMLLACFAPFVRPMSTVSATAWFRRPAAEL